MNTASELELRDRAKVYFKRNDYLIELTNMVMIFSSQFNIQRQDWSHALECLDAVLVKPEDEDVPWMPDMESLLLRSQVR